MSIPSKEDKSFAARNPKGEQEEFYADMERAKQRRVQKTTGPGRYIPGKAPTWASNLEDSDDEETPGREHGLLGRKQVPKVDAGRLGGARRIEASVIEQASGQGGRKRVKAEIVIGDVDLGKRESANKAAAEERELKLELEREEAAIKVKLELANLTVQELPSEEEDEDSEDEADRRRRRARLKAKARETEEKQVEAEAVKEEEEEDEGEESEYETDTDEEV